MDDNQPSNPDKPVRPETPPAPIRVSDEEARNFAAKIIAMAKDERDKTYSSLYSPEALERLKRAMYEDEVVALPKAPESIGLAQEKNQRPRQEDRVYAAEINPLHSMKARQFLEKTIGKMHLATRKYPYQGSTFTGAIITDSMHVVTAHLGDSPAALIFINPKTGEVGTRLLTKPHRPSGKGQTIYEDEHMKCFDIKRDRYYKNKHSEFKDLGDHDYRLAMTHALSDGIFRGHVSKTPTVSVYNLAPRQQAYPHLRTFLLLASDGIIQWDNHRGNPGFKESIDEIGSKLGKILKEHPDTKPDQAAKKLMEIVMGDDGGIGDNVTLALTEVEPRKSKIIAVLDGHGGSRVSAKGVAVLQSEVESQLTKSGHAKA